MPPTEHDDIPPVPVAVIDGYLARLSNRKTVSAVEVRDLLLDIRNAIWSPPSLEAIERVAMETYVTPDAAETALGAS